MAVINCHGKLKETGHSLRLVTAESKPYVPLVDLFVKKKAKVQALVFANTCSGWVDEAASLDVYNKRMQNARLVFAAEPNDKSMGPRLLMNISKAFVAEWQNRKPQKSLDALTRKKFVYVDELVDKADFKHNTPFQVLIGYPPSGLHL